MENTSWIKLINIDPSMLNYPSPMIVSPRPRITTPNKRSASAGAQLQYTNTWQLECKCWHTDCWHLAIGVQVPLSQSKVYWYFWHLECKSWDCYSKLILGNWSASADTWTSDTWQVKCKCWDSIKAYWYLSFGVIWSASTEAQWQYTDHFNIFVHSDKTFIHKKKITADLKSAGKNTKDSQVS